MKCISALPILAVAVVAGRPAAAADLLVTQYKNDPTGAPYAIALEKGFFKQHGVDITGIISGAGGGSSVRAAIASDIGFGDVAAAPVIEAALRGQDLKIVGVSTGSLADVAVVVMRNSPLKTAADMKGKKCGISNPKSLGEVMCVLAMEKAGLKRGDVDMVALGSLGGALTALEKGAVDVTVMPVILLQMRGGESKYRILVHPNELLPVPSQLIMATDKAIKERPDQVRGILAARRDGVKFIYGHTDEAIRILSKVYAPLPPKQVAGMIEDLVKAKFWTDGEIDMRLLQNVVHAMKGVGMLEKDIDLKQVVDASLLPRRK